MVARSVPASPATIGLERRPQCADRYPLGRKRCPTRRRYAADLVALAPDVIPASGALSVAPLQNVDTLARRAAIPPAFLLFEYREMGGTAADRTAAARAAVRRDSTNPAEIARCGAIRATASLLGGDMTQIHMVGAGEVERAVAS